MCIHALKSGNRKRLDVIVIDCNFSSFCDLLFREDSTTGSNNRQDVRCSARMYQAALRRF